VKSEFFLPGFVVVIQSVLVIVDEDLCDDVHDVAQNQTLSDVAFAQTFFNLQGNVYKPLAGWDIEPGFFSVGFHQTLPSRILQGLITTILGEINRRAIGKWGCDWRPESGRGEQLVCGASLRHGRNL
jgi:hypothetical protein